jgi:hypothetical protein
LPPAGGPDPARAIRTSNTPSGANRKRIGTAKTGNRDERHPLPVIGLELAVSGSDPAVPLSQDPAKARRFLGCSRGAGAKSLQPQTTWRWVQARANPSLARVPCSAGKIQVRALSDLRATARKPRLNRLSARPSRSIVISTRHDRSDRIVVVFLLFQSARSCVESIVLIRSPSRATIRA